MPDIIKMPKLSDTMTTGIIKSWKKKVGDIVKTGDILADIETDKAAMELEAYEDGVLLHIGAKVGDTVPVGAILAIIGEAGEDYSKLINQSAESLQESTSSPTESPVPPSTVESVNLQDSQINSKNQIKEEKTQGINKLAESLQEPDIDLESSISKTLENQTKPQESSQSYENIPSSRIKISPLAKKVAYEMGINISNIQGTGDGGRIIKRDIDENISSSNVASEHSEKISNPENLNITSEQYKDIPVTPMRSTIAQKLTQSLATAPHFYLNQEINMDIVVKMKETFKKLGKNISYNDIILKAIGLSIKKFPKINAAWLGDRIRYNKHVHIGIAVSVDDGIVVPVVKFINSKSLLQISSEVKSLVKNSKDKNLALEQLSGATFCTSNLGMYGISSFTSIINPPAACILAIGAIVKKPIVKEGRVEVGNVMKVTLSCDHRAVDGANGAQFLNIFKGILQEPISMLL